MTTQQTNISGWREWLALPDIGIPSVEAKIDTGTTDSTLHTTFIEYFRREGKLWVRFGITPLPQREEIKLVCQAAVKEQRTLLDVREDQEALPVIEAVVQIGQHQLTTDLLLNHHGIEAFTLHLGRNALQELDLLVDPNRTCLLVESKNVSYDWGP